MLRNTSSVLLRLTSHVLLITLLIASCSSSSPSDAYPTYDPFAPLNGTSAPGAIPVGENVLATRPAGPTPTRAPISVAIPARKSNSTFTTPTPDMPHPLPTQRDFLINNTSQPGANFGGSPRPYGTSL